MPDRLHLEQNPGPGFRALFGGGMELAGVLVQIIQQARDLPPVPDPDRLVRSGPQGLSLVAALMQLGIHVIPASEIPQAAEEWAQVLTPQRRPQPIAEGDPAQGTEGWKYIDQGNRMFYFPSYF